MFNFQCYQYNGTILGTCVERFLFGACCGGITLPDPLVVVVDTSPSSNSSTEKSDIDDEPMQKIFLDNLQPIENIEHLQNTPSEVDALSLVSKIVESSSNSTDRPLPNYFHVRPVLSPDNSVVVGEFYADKTQEDEETDTTTLATTNIDTDANNETLAELQSFWTKFFQKQNMFMANDVENVSNVVSKSYVDVSTTAVSESSKEESTEPTLTTRMLSTSGDFTFKPTEGLQWPTRKPPRPSDVPKWTSPLVTSHTTEPSLPTFDFSKSPAEEFEIVGFVNGGASQNSLTTFSDVREETKVPGWLTKMTTTTEKDVVQTTMKMKDESGTRIPVGFVTRRTTTEQPPTVC